MLKLKRAYDAPAASDGIRFLVERLWPRGVKKEELQLDGWLKDVAPSTELRKWFNHEPPKWAEFRRRYFRELDREPDAWRPIVEASRRGAVTLVYSSHDAEHNNAVALKDYLSHLSAAHLERDVHGRERQRQDREDRAHHLAGQHR